MFAVSTDPITILSSGNILLILALVIVTLVGVIIYQNRKIESLYKEKDGLQEKRLQDKVDTSDKYNEAMGEFSRTAQLLQSKLVGRE